MSQNPQDSGESEPTLVSEAAGPDARRRPRPQPASVRTSELEAFRPAPGSGTGPQYGDPETSVPLPPPQALRPKRSPAAVPARRRRRRPKHPRPSFRGPRLADFIGWWRRLRSIVFLVVITVILGMILAAIVAVAVGAIVVAIQHALKSG